MTTRLKALLLALLYSVAIWAVIIGLVLWIRG